MRTPLVDKQIPEQAQALGMSEDDVIKKVMLKETVDGEFTTTADVAADRALLRRLPDQRADRPVAGRQPRLVHAVAAPPPEPSPWTASICKCFSRRAPGAPTAMPSGW